MHHITPALTCLFVALALATPGSALHCNGNILTIDAGDETLYIDDRSAGPGDINHWVYLEDNGEEGLQSGSPCSVHSCDGPIPGFSTNDYCRHANPDLLIL